jgi:hypothetical protein
MVGSVAAFLGSSLKNGSFLVYSLFPFIAFVVCGIILILKEGKVILNIQVKR